MLGPVEQSDRGMFEPGLIAPPTAAEEDLWFSFREDRVLVYLKGEQACIPTAGFMHARNMVPEYRQYLGSWNGTHCYAVGLHGESSLPAGMVERNLRHLYGLIDDELFWIGGRGFQLVTWDRTSQFCGRCGHRMRKSEHERAKVCPSCGFRNYPRISPAVIVAVIREKRILLARAFRFPYKLYSVIAGFVEPGETLEQCVKREVQEEVSIEVRGLRYFGSQPWPFPNSLMIAFTAEYGGGEIRIDEDEIMDAGWFTADNLPPVPDKVSIARRLIDWFVEKHS